jgi:transposase
MRVTSLFNTVLAINGAAVVSVSVADEGVLVGLRRRFRLLTCPCGHRQAACYDRSTRRWRHLDLGGRPLWLEAEIRRLFCRNCGTVRTEKVPWARPGARHTHDFEDTVAWLTQRMDKTAVAELMRCSWEAVDRIAARVVGDHLVDARLNGLRRIGVDEISYKRGHQYLTVVADHDSGRVVWVGVGRSREVLEQFFVELGERRCRKLKAITMDASPAYLAAAAEYAPKARVCLDPFHIIKWTNEALGLVYSSHPIPPTLSRVDWRKTRHALRAGDSKLTGEHRDILNELRRGRYQLGRAWELKEALRSFYS